MNKYGLGTSQTITTANIFNPYNHLKKTKKELYIVTLLDLTFIYFV